jgi:hypothetical protein
MMADESNDDCGGSGGEDDNVDDGPKTKVFLHLPCATLCTVSTTFNELQTVSRASKSLTIEPAGVHYGLPGVGSEM